MISLPGQRATTGPAKRGGARGTGPQGTAPGTGLGARGSLRLVPGPRHQVPQGWAPADVWGGARAQVPGRGKVTQGGGTRAPSGRAGRALPAGRGSVPGGG